jgi:hypothetical protein
MTYGNKNKNKHDGDGAEGPERVGEGTGAVLCLSAEPRDHLMSKH